jgi:hypothetical protein
MSSTPAASTAELEPAHLADTAADYMAVDGEQQAEAEAQPEALELAMPSRSQSPLKLGMLGTSPAAAPQQQQHPAPSFVPLSEMGGSACAAAACLGSSDEEPSTRPDRPASAGGYESGDDMDVLSMQHCTNCTGTLWGHICMVRCVAAGVWGSQLPVWAPRPGLCNARLHAAGGQAPRLLVCCSGC